MRFCLLDMRMLCDGNAAAVRVLLLRSIERIGFCVLLLLLLPTELQRVGECWPIEIGWWWRWKRIERRGWRQASTKPRTEPAAACVAVEHYR
jgi:hypothetical protein